MVRVAERGAVPVVYQLLAVLPSWARVGLVLGTELELPLIGRLEPAKDRLFSGAGVGVGAGSGVPQTWTSARIPRLGRFDVLVKARRT
jgi:hypothetical protein